jgi:hypothetical protein
VPRHLIFFFLLKQGSQSTYFDGHLPIFRGFAQQNAHRKLLLIKCPFSENWNKRGKLPKFEEKLPKISAFGDDLSNFRPK